ncbi:ankyrin repeat domain-containing protein [uncultured Formosa sp.]|uniref:ankyrin repeat domain-containing protein n=1 Tax=uncultured Formosa sp. TaxID=255435 RepID=UPI00263759CD|nr:ankyrin repeat domain-containing protein [uncultured Formosa sp.]
MKTLKTPNFIIILTLLFGVFTACETQYSEKVVEDALWRDDIVKVKQLLKKVDIDTLRFLDGRNILQIAILRGATNVSNYLIENSNLQDSTDNYGYTALHIAILEDHNEKASLLVNKGSDLNILDDSGYTPLHYAILKENIDLVKQMVAKGANINSKTASMKNTPLHLSIELENADLVAFFNSKNAIDTITDYNNKTVKMLALESINPKIVNMYFDSFSNEEKNVLLYNTISQDSITTNLQQWLGQKWVSKETVKEGFVFAKYSTITALLLKNGIDINTVSNRYGYAAINNAAICGNIKMLAFLIENGADINKISDRERSPLMQASKLHDPLIINQEIGDFEISMNPAFLKNLETSPDKNAENSLACVKLLIANNAKLNYTNKDKENALYIAESTFNPKVVDYLKEQGAKESKPFVESQSSKTRRTMDNINRSVENNKNLYGY